MRRRELLEGVGLFFSLKESLDQALDDRHVLQVFMIVVPGSLHDAWKMREAGVVHNVPESFKTDTALADVPVSVLTGTQGYPGVIQVDEKELLKTHEMIDLIEGGVEPFSVGNVVTCPEGMGCIETDADAALILHPLDHRTDLLEPPTNLGPLARCILEKKNDPIFNLSEDLINALGQGRDRLLLRSAEAASHVHDEIGSRKLLCPMQILRQDAERSPIIARSSDCKVNKIGEMNKKGENLCFSNRFRENRHIPFIERGTGPPPRVAGEKLYGLTPAASGPLNDL